MHVKAASVFNIETQIQGFFTLLLNLCENFEVDVFNSFSTTSSSFVACYENVYPCCVMTVIIFLSAIRRCSLVRILCALGQQPVLTIEYLKGEFDFGPNFFRCDFSQ